MLRIFGLGVMLMALSPALLAQGSSVRDSANTIIAKNAENAVEQLVDLGAGSVQAAGVVIEVVATQRPRALAEVMVGLSSVMLVADFQAAVDRAIAVLEEAPAQRVAQLSLQISSGESAAAGSREQGERPGQGEEHRSETANNVEDGRGPPSNPPGPPQREPSLLEQLLTFVFDLLGIDPPASPS